MSSEMELTSGCIFLLCLICLSNANQSPSIEKDVYDVCEDIPLGIPAFTIVASDPDLEPLTYSISGPNVAYFQVEPSTGVVSVIRDLNTESVSAMHLIATVSDSVNPLVSKPIVIIVNDTNNNKPLFEEASYEDTVQENTTVGTKLFKVLATDTDIGNAGTVTYSIDEAVPNAGLTVFSVDELGYVILREKLNYTSLSTFYRIKINATDKGGKCHFNEVVYQSSSVFAFITVEDVPDLDPQFIGIPDTATVKENTPKGSTVLTVTAVDQDTGVNDKIIYSIQASTEKGLFGINEGGNIFVIRDIDRETIGDTVVLTVKATETNPNIYGVRASATAEVHITITDVNDNAPMFYKCSDKNNCVLANSFTGKVKEHSLAPVFMNMTIKDADKNPQTELSLEGEYKDIFSVEPEVVFSQNVVQLTVRQPENLDYEKIQQISLKVIAVDQGDPTLRSTANVTINIIDTNDHSPEFKNDTYYIKVAEHSPDNTTVAVITAEDPDTMDQGKITYRLLPETILPYFDVEPTTGRVYVKDGQRLDREARALFSVTLQARDSDGKPGSTVLEITVTDINDQRPVPNVPSYLQFVSEGENLEITIEATDRDEPGSPNSELVYTIEPGPYSENFTINPKTGVLTNNGPLDREDINPALNGRIELNVTISDKGDPPLSSVVQVIIDVLDVNDNKPVFQQSSYNFSVKEGEKGAFVGSVYAIDHDQTLNFNRISFNIFNGGFGSFMIRSFPNAPGYIGNISLDQDVELDYESSQKSFTLQVEATDIAQEKAEVTVEVHVLDVNDERPEFRPIKPVNVEENSKETGPIGKFDAVDKDGNHSLVYEQVSVKCRCNGTYSPCDWFVLEPNGDVKITPNVTIDYETCTQAIVEAQVVDKYTEKGEANSILPGEMVINIVDVNDNAPEFIYSNSLFVVVSESASKGTSVATVSATDRDSGTNSQIEFQISKVDFKDPNNVTTDSRVIFEAITTQQNDIYVGIIQSTEKLDTKLKGRYMVTVVARDTGGLSKSTVLEIFVIDESYKIQLRFDAPWSEIAAQEPEITRDLLAVTQAAVRVVAIKPEGSQPSKASGYTVMEVYFVYANGTALTSSTVQTLLSRPENYMVLSKYKLIYVGIVNPTEPPEQTLEYVLFGMVGSLIIVTAVLTTSLLCSRRNYQRKLRAANAMKSASAVMSENQKGGPVVPGTNQYTMEGANPVLNLNIDTAIPLDLGEESDVDKVSLYSLDNSDDMMCEKDTKPIIQKIKEEDEDKEDNGPPEYIEPLGAALAQRDQKISSNNPLLGDTNPIFDTTDL